MNGLTAGLCKGETIFHSTMACHVSARFPDGKWISQIRCHEKGKLVRYPVKGIGIPEEAMAYVKILAAVTKVDAQLRLALVAALDLSVNA